MGKLKNLRVASSQIPVPEKVPQEALDPLYMQKERLGLIPPREKP